MHLNTGMSLFLGQKIVNNAKIINGLAFAWIMSCTRSLVGSHFPTKGLLHSDLQVLLSIILSWSLCAILTHADVLPVGSTARTDLRLNVSHRNVIKPFGQTYFSNIGDIGLYWTLISGGLLQASLPPSSDRGNSTGRPRRSRDPTIRFSKYKRLSILKKIVIGDRNDIFQTLHLWNNRV